MAGDSANPDRLRNERARAPRIHHAEGLAPGATVVLDQNALRHLAALRLERGDPIVLFSGDGHEYAATLVSLTKREAAAKVTGVAAVDRESPLAVTLAQGICAADRMDLLVQKATELGVTVIQPLITDRTVIRLSADRQERREQHWQAVAVAACEQSGRNRIPTVQPSVKLDQYVASLGSPDAAARLMLSPAGDRRLAELPRAAAAIVAVGPEGGFAPDEQALLASRGFVQVRFGPRTLRTETAPLAVIAALQVLWGDC